MQLPKLDRFLLGDNPFIGVDHLSQERARERQTRLNSFRICDVINTAIANGAEGLLFTTHPIMYDALNELKKQADTVSLGLYPLLPYAHAYVQMATEKGIVGLFRAILSSLSWKSRAKAVINGGLSLASMDPERALRAYVDAELEILSKKAPKQALLKCVLLHEVITDLSISFGASDLLMAFANHIMDEYHVRPGFVTRNFSRFVDFASRSNLPLDRIVTLTPFNGAGFQMNPSREACELTLSRLSAGHVIAMSILAAGFLKLNDAVRYLNKHPRINSFVVGASTNEHAKETFSNLRSMLDG